MTAEETKEERSIGTRVFVEAAIIKQGESEERHAWAKTQ